MSENLFAPNTQRLGFGLMRLPLSNPDDATSVDHKQFCEMVDYFLSEGFTYFDTAFPYHKGTSEEAAKKALIDRHPRESFTLTDKMPSFLITCKEDYDKYFDIQIRRTGVTYFDYYLLHNLGKANYATSEKYGGFDYMQKLKAEGKVRHIGFSFHDSAELLDEILQQHPEMEFVQLQINYADWESPSVQSRKCYEVAQKHRKPVLVMEPVRGGALATPGAKIRALFDDLDPNASSASFAIRFVASLPNVQMVLSGMSNMQQMKDNVAFMKKFKALSEHEREVILQASEIIRKLLVIPCTACQYCVDDCPKQINIPGIFSVYNAYKQFGDANFPSMHYERQTAEGGKAEDCIRCGRCESHCPQHISIREHLKTISKIFDVPAK